MPSGSLKRAAISLVCCRVALALQQSTDLHVFSEGQVLSSLMERNNISYHELDTIRQQNQAILQNNKAMRQDHAILVARARDLLSSNDKQALQEGWKAFRNKAGMPGNPKPQEMLKYAKSALIQTGAMAVLRSAAKQMGKGLVGVGGTVPLDSMIVGFKTTLAPWNNLLKEFSLPLIKASFSLFSNFFGPEGNAARICISANTAADSTYHAHKSSEFGGISIFVGPAKWDNVPGWSFGASGGIDDMKFFDVADFGWAWTLAKEPETVCFHFDICLIDSEGLKVSTLQLGSQVEIGEGTSTMPVHGSTWVGHTWCSPDWENTPLVVEDASPATMASAKEATPTDEAEPFFKKEEWDPDTEAV